ncbi:MAG: ribosome maturation protein RimP [Sphingomicrobium sp.]|nr:ribosome maturation protein RimP [Sphingomonadales bacterium]
MADIAAITALIAPEADALGLRLVRVAMIGGTTDPTLQVMAERPDTRQLDLGDCETLSRRISEKLDGEEADGRDPVDGAYRLEVSSPGIDRPLTRRADYADWAGHEARIKFVEPQDGAKQVSGVIEGIDGERISIATPKGVRAFAFDTVASAKLLLTDKLINATAPLSTDGADKIEVDPRPADEVSEHIKTES